MGIFDCFRRSKTSNENPKQAITPKDSPSLPEWASFFGTSGRYDEFERLVRSHFSRSGGRAWIVEGMVRVVAAPGGGMSNDEASYGLLNLAQTCSKLDAEEWPQAIERHFRLMREAERRARPSAVPLEQARDKLGLHLWPMNDTKLIQTTIWREDFPGLASMLWIDAPESVSSVKPEDAAPWGLSDKELLDIATANQPALAPVRRETHRIDAEHALYELLGESPFACSVALHIRRMPDLMGPHGSFVSIPTRSRVLVLPLIGAETVPILTAMMRLAVDCEREGPGSISSNVYLMTHDRILQVPFEINEKGISVFASDEVMEILNRLT